MKTKTVRFLGQPGGPAQVVIPMKPEDWENVNGERFLGAEIGRNFGDVTKMPSGHALWRTDELDEVGTLDVRFTMGILASRSGVTMPPITFEHFENNPAWSALVDQPGAYRLMNDFALFADHDPILGRTQAHLVASRPNNKQSNYPLYRYAVGDTTVVQGPVEIGDGMAIPYWVDPVNYGISLDWMDHFGFQLSPGLDDAWVDAWIQKIRDTLARRQNWYDDYPLGHPKDASSSGMHAAFQPIQDWALAAIQLGRPDVIPLAMECMKEWALRGHHHVQQGRGWKNGEVTALEPDEHYQWMIEHPDFCAIHRGVPHFDSKDYLVGPYENRTDFEANYQPNGFGLASEKRSHTACFDLWWTSLFAWSPYWERELRWAKEGTKAYAGNIDKGEGEERGGGRFFLDLGSLDQLVPDADTRWFLTKRASRFIDLMEASSYGPVDIKPAGSSGNQHPFPIHQPWQGFIWCDGRNSISGTGASSAAAQYALNLAENCLHRQPDGSWMVSYQHRVNAVWSDQNKRWEPEDGHWPIQWIGAPQALLAVHQSLGGIWVAAVAGSVKARECIAWADSTGDSACWCPHARPWLALPEPEPEPDPDTVTVERVEIDTLRQHAEIIADRLRWILEPPA